MKRLLLISALLATGLMAQTTTTFTNSVSIGCGDYPYPYTQYFHFLVEGATPPYSGAQIPPPYQISKTNHTPGVTGCYFQGLTGIDASGNTVTATFNVWQLRYVMPSGQEFGCYAGPQAVWVLPSPYPAEGEPAIFTLDCDGQDLQRNAGHLHIALNAAFQWVVEPPNTRGWIYILKEWFIPVGALSVTVTM